MLVFFSSGIPPHTEGEAHAAASAPAAFVTINRRDMYKTRVAAS